MSVPFDDMNMEDWDAQLLGQMRLDFMEESLEHLERLNLHLTGLQETPQDQDLVSEIFRIVHTLKGTAAFIGLDEIRDIAHRMEDVFGAIRKGALTVTIYVVDVMFEAHRVLTRLRERAAVGTACECNDEPDVVEILSTLSAVMEYGLPPAEEEPPSETDSPSAEELPPETEESFSEQPDVVPSTPGMGLSSETVRVPTERLDSLMNLTGELITSRNRLNAFSDGLGNEELAAIASSIDRLTRRIHYGVMGIRMVPIERLFNRFPSVVRKLAREQEKEVELVLQGKETELDKAIVEQIHDPLVHLLRNAIAHGIESAETRRERGKPPEGRIRLSSRHHQNSVIIEVADDGHGMDPEEIKHAALQKELITEDEAHIMGDDAAVRLIFAPGFSTADEVTDVSGRGIGMDVVKESVRKLRGIVDIQTAVGRGTTFRIQLPLTLAVLQVLLVEAAGLVYALPLAAIRETLLMNPSKVKKAEKSEVFLIRGERLFLKRLEALLDRPSDKVHKNESVPVVVVGLAEKRMGIMVDKLLSKQEVVLKPLGRYLGKVRGIEGAAILTDGSMTLVVDIEAMSGSLRASRPLNRSTQISGQKSPLP